MTLPPTSSSNPDTSRAYTFPSQGHQLNRPVPLDVFLSSAELSDATEKKTDCQGRAILEQRSPDTPKSTSSSCAQTPRSDSDPPPIGAACLPSALSPIPRQYFITPPTLFSSAPPPVEALLPDFRDRASRISSLVNQHLGGLHTLSAAINSLHAEIQTACLTTPPELLNQTKLGRLEGTITHLAKAVCSLRMQATLVIGEAAALSKITQE